MRDTIKAEQSTTVDVKQKLENCEKALAQQKLAFDEQKEKLSSTEKQLEEIKLAHEKTVKRLEEEKADKKAEADKEAARSNSLSEELLTLKKSIDEKAQAQAQLDEILSEVQDKLNKEQAYNKEMCTKYGDLERRMEEITLTTKELEESYISNLFLAKKLFLYQNAEECTVLVPDYDFVRESAEYKTDGWKGISKFLDKLLGDCKNTALEK